MQGDTGKILFLFVEDIMMGGGFPKQMCTPHTAGIFYRSGHEISKPPPPSMLSIVYAACGYRDLNCSKFQCLFPSKYLFSSLLCKFYTILFIYENGLVLGSTP